MDVLTHVMGKWHVDLGKAGVGISVLMVHPPVDDDGEETGAPAIKLHGAACYAKIKRLSAEDRAMAAGSGVIVDARMEIDAKRWESLSDKQRAALIDHELTHLYLREDTVGAVMEHDDKRPKLFMRPDDWQINGFQVVTNRHGRNSIEFASLTAVVEETLDGQLWFSFSDHKKVLFAAAARSPGLCTLHPDGGKKPCAPKKTAPKKKSKPRKKTVKKQALRSGTPSTLQLNQAASR